MSDRRPPSYNNQIGSAFTVSSNGVLRVDVDNQYFRDELLKQFRLLRRKDKHGLDKE
mgnify:CR=1 FL=1